jgi:hypothetical protein
MVDRWLFIYYYYSTFHICRPFLGPIFLASSNDHFVATITQPCHLATQQSRNLATQQSRILYTTISQPCNATITQPTNATITQPCNATITQPCNATITQPCNATITQTCDATIRIVMLQFSHATLTWLRTHFYTVQSLLDILYLIAVDSIWTCCIYFVLV